jgi:nicotinamidase-related amidase
MKTLAKLACCGMLFAVATAIVPPAPANDITKEWDSVKPPPVPELKPATVDPKTTALLALDFMKANCGVRPRCAATIPIANKLIEQAHAQGMLVIYTLVGENPKPEGMADGIQRPKEGEWIERGGADKFINSDIDQRLKARGIKTVIVMGTSAQGAVVGTSNGAVQRGFQAVVPVDAMSAEDPYNEQYAAWHLYKGGPVYLPKNVTLTRGDMIKFGN